MKRVLNELEQTNSKMSINKTIVVPAIFTILAVVDYSKSKIHIIASGLFFFNNTGRCVSLSFPKEVTYQSN